MSKVYIWIGQFQSNAEFETYINQSKFRQWWAEHDEDNLELSCQFCKELNISSYDEDFLVTKFSPCGIDELVKMIPAKTEKVMQLCKEQNIQCNFVKSKTYKKQMPLSVIILEKI